MPKAKQEQLIAELIAKSKHRESLTEAERRAEDEETMKITTNFNHLLSQMDAQQRNIILGNMQQMMPSGQMNYMKQLIEEGAEALIPPSEDEVKEWKAIYLSYFNSEFSVKHGRALPLKYCVKNPRPDEVVDALKALKIRAIFEAVSILPLFAYFVTFVFRTSKDHAMPCILAG